MTRAQRLCRLEAQRRPVHIAAVLARVRQCPPADLRACLQDELTAVDRTTALAIMEQLTDVELEALLGAEACRSLAMLSDVELEALARGDPAATRQVQRMLRSVQPQGNLCL